MESGRKARHYMEVAGVIPSSASFPTHGIAIMQKAFQFWCHEKYHQKIFSLFSDQILVLLQKHNLLIFNSFDFEIPKNNENKTFMINNLQNTYSHSMVNRCRQWPPNGRFKTCDAADTVSDTVKRGWM